MYKQKGRKVSAHCNNFALITGASGGLGSSLVAEFLNDPAIDKVATLSMAGSFRNSATNDDPKPPLAPVIRAKLLQ